MSDAMIPRRNTAEPAPLSFGQELFWLLDRATPGLTAYHVPRAWRVRGALNQSALGRALDLLIERHEVLRTVYQVSGDHPVQVVRGGVRVPFETIEVPGPTPALREGAAAEMLRTIVSRPFDLREDVLLRATLLRLDDQDHILLLVSHHIASDGWSKSVMVEELSELYAAGVQERAPALPPLPIQFADFAAWQRATLAGAELEPSLAYWRQQLRGPLPVLSLPTDRAGPSGHTFEGGVRETVLPASLVQGMRHLGQSHGATLYMVLLAAYQSLLHRYSGQDDVHVGSPTAGRDREDIQGLIGYFANALVLRTSFADDPSFSELLDRVRDTCLDAYEHQDVPFETLVLELQKGEQLTHAPLFQCVLTMEDTVPATFELGTTALTPVAVEVAGTKFDLTLLFSIQPGGLRLRLGFRTALFDADRMERMLSHLHTLLEAAVKEPGLRVSEIPLLAADERRRLLSEWNHTAWEEGEPATIHGLIERHAARTPRRDAVIGADGTLGWEELNTRANQIAHWLVRRGIGPGSTVGLCLDRSAALIAGMLGVLKAGAAYVPLLPDLPSARLEQQMARSGITLVVTNGAPAALLPAGTACLRLDADAATLAGMPRGNPAPRATPDSLAYVLFTSGSTGEPKGVGVTHANLVHYTRAIAQRVGLDLTGDSEPWHCATVSTLGADLGHTAVFPSLCSGGTLHVLDHAVAAEPDRFAEYVAVHPLDLLKITPNHLRALLPGQDAAKMLPRRWLVLGGEACSRDLARELLRAGVCRVLNHYGPTETTVGACTHEVLDDEAGDAVPIGRPLSNTRAYVLDWRGEPAPIGVPGELWIGGAGVTQGYVGREDLTRERFVPDRFGGAPEGRLYRTGDRARWLSSGVLEFLGRADDQVKIRGFRVEPGEVEVVLSACPGLRQAVVLALPDPDGATGLVAYLGGEALPDDAALSQWLGERLPQYMIPSRWVRLATLPLTPNGKVDRRALPAAGAVPAGSATEAPRTGTERMLASLFADVLKRPSVSVDEDFFKLGGHSLLAIRLLGRISKETGTRVSLRELFETPTVRRLADRLDRKGSAPSTDALAAALGRLDPSLAAQLMAEATGNWSAP
jgi:amino acid adenylation domain-containing protein